MCLDYSRLWKLLIDKNLNKTDLIELTGISSRVVAKLSKNETVTTDTLARICSALECELEDIAELRADNTTNLHSYIKNNRKPSEECDTYKLIDLTFGGEQYLIYFLKPSLTKSTRLICSEDGTVYLEQYFPFGGMSTPIKSRTVLLRPRVLRDAYTLIVTKGKPSFIYGLDAGIFNSHSPHTAVKKGKATLMSESELKLLS